MDVTIEYCAVCNYEPRVLELLERLLKFKYRLGTVRLIPAGNAAFEVFVDGQCLHSKRSAGTFPDPDELLRQLREHDARRGGGSDPEKPPVWEPGPGSA